MKIALTDADEARERIQSLHWKHRSERGLRLNINPKPDRLLVD
jgi:hypothetical protein